MPGIELGRLHARHLFFPLCYRYSPFLLSYSRFLGPHQPCFRDECLERPVGSWAAMCQTKSYTALYLQPLCPHPGCWSMLQGFG